MASNGEANYGGPITRAKKRMMEIQAMSKGPMTRARKRALDAAILETGTPHPQARVERRPAKRVRATPRDHGDPLECNQYVKRIYSRYRRLERRYLVPQDYLSKQNEVTARHRAQMIDWMFSPSISVQTIQLAVNYVDRYLAARTIPVNQLQLVGAAALLIACKYEEVVVHPPVTFVDACNNIFTLSQLLDMELDVWFGVGGDLSCPTVHTFALRFRKLTDCLDDTKVGHLADYLGVLAAADARMLKYKYSEIAAAAVYVARVALGGDETVLEEVARASGYSKQQVVNCARDLLEVGKVAGDLWQQKEEHSATGRTKAPMTIAKKFSRPALGCVSNVLLSELAV